jgi:hypothetical protein
MRFKILILLSWLLANSAAWAGEKLPVLKVGSDVYSNVTVTSVTATDIIFTSDNGMGNAKLKNLDAALQKRFGYDATKAAAIEKKQKDASIDPMTTLATPFDPTNIDLTNYKSIMDEAYRRVRIIVNQPVRKFARSSAMEQVAKYSPGWFHAGASKPDFNTVDVRTSQDLNYGKDQYITSDVTPGVVFLGADCEFNSMTKYFYVDRSVPKKKLTEAEMVEINRLYRIIGKCENTVAPPPSPVQETEVTTETDAPQPNPPVMSRDYLSMHKKELVLYGSIALGVLLVIKVLMLVLKKKG